MVMNKFERCSSGSRGEVMPWTKEMTQRNNGIDLEIGGRGNSSTFLFSSEGAYLSPRRN